MTTTLSTAPKVLDFELYAGDGFAVGFEFVDQVTGAPYPLDGTWLAQIRNRTDVLTEFTIDDTEQTGGKIKLSLTGEQTAALPGCYRGQNGSSACSSGCPSWDLEQSFVGGPRTWYRGKVHTLVDVTRVVVP